MKIALLAALVAALVVPAASASTRTLKGTVGPGFTITLKQSGKTVKLLKAGTYQFVVSDQSSIHNFTLKPPSGPAKTLTSTSFTGKKTVKVTLKKGKYKYVCTVHASTMFGFFTVK